MRSLWVQHTEAVVAKEKEKQATYQEQYDSVKERIAALDNL